MDNSFLEGWLENVNNAIPWALTVMVDGEKYPNDVRAAAATVLGVQGVVRELEQRALVAERTLDALLSTGNSGDLPLC